MQLKFGKVWSAVSLLALWAGPVLSQVMDTGVLSPKEQEARDAGIGTYRIQQNGSLSNVTVWGSQGEDLATCEIQWQERGTEASCSFAAGGRYRWAWDGSLERGSFEDLVTGDAITFRFVWDSPPPEGLIHMAPGEDLPTPTGAWVVEGGKTKEQAEAVWSEAGVLVSQIVGEVLQSLGDVSLGGTPARETSPASFYGGCGPNEQEV